MKTYQKQYKRIFDESRIVHWIFECGCEHKGYFFTTHGKKMCHIHRKKVKTEFIKCAEAECGKIFEIKSKGRSPIFCSSCIRKKHHAEVKNYKRKPPKIIKKCSVDGCNQNVKPGNLFLCPGHYYYGL